MKKLKNFIILGVSKCGTTGLYGTIIQHPQISPAKNKEIYFFGSTHYSKGEKWYNQQLGKCGENQITGESTPPYIYRIASAYQMYRYNKDLKFIIMLRHPIKRVISHYNHCNQYNKSKSVSDFLDRTLKRIKLEAHPYLILNHIIGKSCYYPMIKYWFSYFTKEQFLFIKSEDYFTKPQKELSKIYSFLNIEDFKTPVKHLLKGKYKAVFTKEDIKRLEEYYEPYNKLLPSLIGENFKWEYNT